MKRRAFITLLGGATAWPLAVRAQQAAMPVIGFLDLGAQSKNLDAFNRGLADTGYVAGRNVAIELRSTASQYDEFRQLVMDLVRRNVAVIATSHTPAALVAKAATTTIPIVFSTAADPVKLGLVASLARPGGNVTGISFFSAELAAKRLALLRELVPAAARVAVLVNPADATRAQSTVKDVEAAARVVGLEIRVLEASTSGEIDAAFASIARARVDAIFVAPDGFFNTRRGHAGGAPRHPCGLCAAGLCRSRRADELRGQRLRRASSSRGLRRSHPQGREAGRSAGPAADQFEFVINLQTAKAIGLTVPDKLLVAADEVIE